MRGKQRCIDSVNLQSATARPSARAIAPENAAGSEDGGLIEVGTAGLNEEAAHAKYNEEHEDEICEKAVDQYKCDHEDEDAFVKAAHDKYIEEHEEEILEAAAEKYKEEHEDDESLKAAAARLLADAL